MGKSYSVTVQGVDRNLREANGDCEPIDFNDLSEDKALDIVERFSQIRIKISFENGDVCPPSLNIQYKNGEVYSFYPEDGKIYYAESGGEVAPEDVIKIANGEIKLDKREILKEKYEREGVKPLRKPEIKPTDRENISASDISTGEECPQFTKTVWKSRYWFEASHVAPFSIGAFFLIIGLIVLSEGRDAEAAPYMLGLALVSFLSFFPWRALAKTKLTAGIDWNTNTLWFKRKRKGIVGYEPDANMISEVRIKKFDEKMSNPLWIMEPAAPMVFNKREWLLKAKRAESETLWTIKGASLATKKEALAIVEKLQKLLRA